MWSATAYAYGAGVVAAFNPCGFVLLPTYAAGFLVDDQRGGQRSATLVSAQLLAGFVSVFATVGLAVGALGASTSAVTRFTSWSGLVLGIALIGAGIALLAGMKLPGLALSAGSSRTAFSYGIAYATASLACALPVFLSAVVLAFRQGGALDGLAAGLAYSLGMASVTTGVVLLAARANRHLLTRVRALTAHFTTASGVLLTTAGAVLVARPFVDMAWLDDAAAALSRQLNKLPLLPALIVAVIVCVPLAAKLLRKKTGAPDNNDRKDQRP